MTAKITRGSPSRKRPVSRGGGRSTARSVSTRKKKKKESLLDSFGVPEATGRRVGGWLVALLGVAIVVTGIIALRLPQLAGTAVAQSVGDAGFAMRRVEIKGAQRVSRLDIYNIAFDQPGMAMPLVDLAATRERLLQFGWIKDARVHRRLPDTLVIDVIERQPAAIWQNRNELTLVDAEGVLLEPVKVEAMPDLPLVIGPGAHRHLAALGGLVDGAPHLKPQISGATWVGGRRWDVRFQTGELLSLPEGDEAARRALLSFARMDQQTQLLGRGFVRFDMRIPGRFIVRVSREPGSTVPALVPPDPGARPEDLSRTI